MPSAAANNNVDMGDDVKKSLKPPLFHPFSRRFHMILLILAAFFTMNLMRQNIGIGMTCMVNSTAIAQQAILQMTHNATGQPHLVDLAHAVRGNHTPQSCGLTDSGEKIINDYGGDLVWDPDMQGHIFAGALYGTMITLIPGGLLADLWHPVYMLQISAIFLILGNLFTPVMAEYIGPWSVFVVRFCMGLGEGMILPSINKLASQWIPNDEKSTAVSIYTSGNQLGGILGLPIFAYLCGTSLRWPSVFYSAAISGILWLILWRYFASSNPQKCKMISERERDYLESHAELKCSKKHATIAVPWRAMITSLPFLSLMCCNFATNMVASIIPIYIPTFLKEVLFLSTVDNGLFSAIPPLFQFFSKIVWSIFIDALKRRGLNPTVAVRVSQSIASFGGAICFILIGYYANCESPVLTLFLLCAMTLCFSTATSGFFTSMISLAPSYTGIITSVSFFCGILGRFAPTRIVPYFNKTGSLEEWRKVFIVTAAILTISGLFFVCVGSGKVQKWGIRKGENESIKEKEDTTALTKEETIQMGSIMISEVADA